MGFNHLEWLEFLVKYDRLVEDDRTASVIEITTVHTNANQCRISACTTLPHPLLLAEARSAMGSPNLNACVNIS